MKNILEPLNHIQFDHSRWLNELLFSAKEIDLYLNRLLEMADEFDDGEKARELTALVDQFDEQRKQTIDLQSKIKKHVIKMSHLTHSNGELKAMIDSIHNETRQEMENFRHQYTNLKETFHRFSAFQD